MFSISRLAFIQRYVLSSFFIFLAIYKLSLISELTLATIANSFLKPLIIGLFLFVSSSNLKKIDFKDIFGLSLSFIPPYFLKLSTNHLFQYEQIVLLITYSYVSICFFISLINLGSSFSIIPGHSEIKTHGMYSVVRHPLYSSYISFFLVTLILNFNVINAVLFGLFYFGLYLRAKSEETFLANIDPGYKQYISTTPRFLSLVLMFPLFILVTTLSIRLFATPKNTIQINIAYPVFSTHPLKADDWSSFFVINHIYPRITAEQGEFRKNSIVKEKNVTCAEKGKSILSSSCKRAKVELIFRSKTKMCNGLEYNFQDFQNEFKQIVDYKNWLFPNLKPCQGSSGSLCFTLDNNININHALRSIYLRFGWSKEKENSNVAGMMPNCFYPKKLEDGLVTSSILETTYFDLYLSTDDKDKDIYLYGNKINSPNLSDLNYYNPIYYFLITSGDITSQTPPWLSDENKDQIRGLFEKEKIISKNYNADLLTKNLAVKSSILHSKKPMTYRLIIPDYLDNCTSIARKMEVILNRNKSKVLVVCENISAFVENSVKKVGTKWDAYITPLTPGLPGNEALLIQYFSPVSNESWLGKNNASKSEVFLIGSSEGVVQTKKNLFCSVKPNPLGLSDLTIDDFIRCD